MITANFNTYASYVTDSLSQWDINQELRVTGINISVAPEVHFSNANMDKAIVRQATLNNHVVTVGIPNSLLQEPLTIEADIGIYEGDTFKIIERVAIPVKPKTRPADYQIQNSDEEIYSFKALENSLKNKADRNQVANIIAHNNDTDGNSELVDLRYGADGNTYPTAGDASREQMRKINVFPHYADFWYLGSEFYFESGADYAVYLKFESLTRRTSTIYNRHDWPKIKSDINNDSIFVTSPKGVENCLLLNYFDYLGYDPKTNAFFVDERPLDPQYDKVIVAFNAWGRLENCLLSNMAGGYYIEDFPLIRQNASRLQTCHNILDEANSRISAIETGINIPDYWDQTLTSKIKQINTYQSVNGSGASSFAFITDVHNCEKMDLSRDLLMKITRECSISHVFNGGDMVSGAGKCAKTHIIDELTNVKNTFSKIENMIFLEGNHDSAYDETTNEGYYLQNFTDGENYNYIHRVNKDKKITLLGKSYGYIDDDLAKIRYIFVNTSDIPYITTGGIMATGYNKMKNGGINIEQFRFILQALRAPSGYSILLLSHIPIYQTGVKGADISITNGDKLLEALKAVKNKTTFTGNVSAISTTVGSWYVNYDFSDVDVNIIGCLAGHTHYDNLVTVDGINHITTLNNSMNVWDDAPNKEHGTTSECAFDIFTIDTLSKSVWITRVGAGEDRSFTY